jgi:hypothetical protein
MEHIQSHPIAANISWSFSSPLGWTLSSHCFFYLSRRPSRRSMLNWRLVLNPRSPYAQMQRRKPAVWTEMDGPTALPHGPIRWPDRGASSRLAPEG